MPVADYTVAELIDDVYRARYGIPADDATADERANIVRFAEEMAREGWKRYHWYFGLKQVALTVSITGTITIPSDCESILEVTDSSRRKIRYTQRGVTVITIDPNQGVDVSGSGTLDVEYRTVEPTYGIAETASIPSPMYTYLKNACVAHLWGSDRQPTKYDSWMAKAYQSLKLAVDVIERQRNLKRKPKVLNYRSKR